MQVSLTSKSLATTVSCIARHQQAQPQVAVHVRRANACELAQQKVASLHAIHRQIAPCQLVIGQSVRTVRCTCGNNLKQQDSEQEGTCDHFEQPWVALQQAGAVGAHSDSQSSSKSNEDASHDGQGKAFGNWKVGLGCAYLHCLDTQQESSH